MAGSRIVVGILAVVILAAGAPARGDNLSPVVAASIHDEPLDGLGDSFNNPPFQGLLRQQSYREDRAIHEYDVSAYGGMTVTSATVSGTIFVNNTGGSWPRLFDFILYAGNGVADLSDYQIAGTVVDTLSWPTYSPPLSYSIDVAATVQTLLDGGAQYVGLRVDPTSMDSFPSILDDVDALLSIEATGGGYDVGDMNCDGAVNSYDIDGFICALSPQCDYESMYPDCDRMLADCNGDGDVNSYDIDGFIALVGGG